MPSRSDRGRCRVIPAPLMVRLVAPPGDLLSLLRRRRHAEPIRRATGCRWCCMVDLLGQTRSPQGRTTWQQSDSEVGILGEFLRRSGRRTRRMPRCGGDGRRATAARSQPVGARRSVPRPCAKAYRAASAERKACVALTQATWSLDFPIPSHARLRPARERAPSPRCTPPAVCASSHSAA